MGESTAEMDGGTLRPLHDLSNEPEEKRVREKRALVGRVKTFPRERNGASIRVSGEVLTKIA
jgi:hypothetical protein